MYITVKTIKRDLGFKGIQISDVLLGFPIVALFILLFSLTSYKLLALVVLMVGLFLLLPINVSKKNRMYKVIFLVFRYIFKTKIFVYTKHIFEKDRVIKINELKKRLRY